MLKKLREEKNLTQTELAYLSKVSIKTISRIENGDDKVQYRTVKKLAEFFNTKIENIMEK